MDEPIVEEPIEEPKPAHIVNVEVKEDYDAIEVIEDGVVTEKYKEYFRIYTETASYRLNRGQLDELSPKIETDKFIQLPEGIIIPTSRITSIQMFKDMEE